MYPQYLLGQILDRTGRAITASSPDSLASESISWSSHTTRGESDQQLHEVGQQPVQDFTARLAMQRTMDGMDLHGVFCLRLSVIAQLLLAVFVAIFIIGTTGPMDQRVSHYMNAVDQVSVAYEATILTVYSAAYAVQADPISVARTHFGGIPFMREITGTPIDLEFPVLDNPEASIWSSALLAKQTLELAMAELVQQRGEIWDVIDLFLLPEELVYVRPSGLVPPYYNWSFEEASYYFGSARAILSAGLDFCAEGAAYVVVREADALAKRKLLFQGTWNVINSAQPVLLALAGLIDAGRMLVGGYSESASDMSLIIPLAFGILFVVLQSIALRAFYHDIDQIMTIMRHLSSATAESSLFPISRGTTGEKVNSGASKLNKASALGYRTLPMVIVGLLIADCVGFFLAFGLTVERIGDTIQVFEWYLDSARRTQGLMFILGMLDLLPVAPMMDTTNKSDTGRPRFSHHLTILHTLAQAFDDDRYSLLIWTGEAPPLIGYDQSLDRMQLSEACMDDAANFYHFSRCLSLNRGCSLASTYVRAIVTHFGAGTSDIVNDHDYIRLLTLIETSLSERLYAFTDRLLQFSRDLLASMGTILVIGMTLIIGVNIMLVIVLRCQFNSFRQGLEAIRRLIRLLPPRDILAYPRLVDVITGMTHNETGIRIAASEIIVREAPDGILSVSTDYKIDSLNNAVHTITGLSADEIIGQTLSILFPLPPEDAESENQVVALYDVLEKLKGGELTGEQALEITTANDLPAHIQVAVLIIPAYALDGVLEKFTLILRDISKQLASEAEARLLKDRCDLILEKSVPIEVYQAIRRPSATHSSFVTNVGTMIRVDIVGLRECVSAMSPSQVMYSLAGIFNAFDAAIAPYPAIHIVRAHEEGIVACCGVFDYSTTIREQAEQAAAACLAFRDMRDEINDTLVLDLHYRISIVQGGPLMGGPLDCSTPSFDLMGDVVATGEMLCREAEPGTVRINLELQSSLDPIAFVTAGKPKNSKHLLDTIVLIGNRE
jgi:PAS domain S-box-containing protein